MSEAEYLEIRSDCGAYDDMLERDYYNRQEAKHEEIRILNFIKKELKSHNATKKQYGKTVDVTCVECKISFPARISDRKRGWGRFCTKRCKAINQAKR